MSGNVLALAIEFVVQTAFLLAGLWIMIKLQKLDHNWPGLLGAAALASGLDMIPLAGHYLAVPVLLFCIAKVTRAERVDVVFTVALGYALMFGMNLWLLSALLGDLRPSARKDLVDEIAAAGTELDEPGANDSGPPAARIPATSAAARASAPTGTQHVSQPAPSSGSKAAQDLAKILSLKGVVLSANKPTATISTGAKTYIIAVGETLSMETAKGKTAVHCESVDADSAVLTVAGERVKLKLLFW